MFPVSDFNFMVAGIATFAVTVGYTYARGKLNSTTPGTLDRSEQDEEMSVSDGRGQIENKRIMEAGPSSLLAHQASLKRKEPHDGFEDEAQLGYPHNLANIYPRKRCRTPSSGDRKGKKPVCEATPLSLEEPSFEDWIFIQNMNSPSPQESEPPRTPSPGLDSAAPTPAAEVTDSPLLVTKPIPTIEDSPSQKPIPVIEPKELDSSIIPVATRSEGRPEANEAKEVESRTTEATEPPTTSTQEKSNAFGKTSPFTPVSSIQKFSLQKPIASPFAARGFADFAGAKSSFGAFRASQTPAQTLGRSIWASELDEMPETTSQSDHQADAEEDHALKQVKSAVKPVTTQVTGEENEDTAMELKGIRLYVKRGEKPFLEGITGHCKLLRNKTTSEERILFRREPLRKVSMNVRVNPSVRCSFDAGENVLRIVTQEPKAEAGSAILGDKNSLEIVVYALKAGRSCSRQDFKVFSENLIKNPRLKRFTSA